MKAPGAIFLGVCLFLGGGGRTSAADLKSASTNAVVGSLGRKEALVLEGNRSFTRDQIWDGLSWQIDFLLAAHPAAPLNEYLQTLQTSIRAGYLREGFPEATVAVALRTNASQILATIHEGPRFTCGELRLEGLEGLTNNQVMQALTRAVYGPEPEPGKEKDDANRYWSRTNNAPFDATALQLLTLGVSNVLAELNWFQPKFTCAVVPDPARKKADLVVKILDRGIKATIDEFEVSGLTKNTREQLLTFLELKPGMAVDASHVNNISNRLWNSARFIRQQVALRPRDQPGSYQLQIQLKEYEEAPALNQPFAPEEQALLKMRDWFLQWASRPEDLVIVFSNAFPRYSGSGEIAISPRGAAFLLRASGPASIFQPFVWGGIFSPGQAGLYSGWRRHKWVRDQISGHPTVFLHLLPLEGEANQNFNFTCGASVGTSDEAFEFDLKMAPVAMLDFAHLGWNYSQDKGIVTLSMAEDMKVPPAYLKLDAKTGRLLESRWASSNQYAQITFERGGFARIRRIIESAAAAYTNDYDSNAAISSTMASLCAEVFQNPFLEALSSKTPEERATWKFTELCLNRLTINPGFTLKQMFASFERIPAWSGFLGHRAFQVPFEDKLVLATDASRFFALAGVLLVRGSDQLWPSGTWLAILTRETGFLLARRGKYSAQIFTNLAQSRQIGPLGCALAVLMFSRLDPELARPFAARGASAMNLSEFQNDLRLLLRGNSTANQLCSNLVCALATLTPEEARTIGKVLDPASAAFLTQALSRLHAATNQPLDLVLQPVVQAHWEKFIKPRLLALLEPYLPLNVEPATPEGQFARGVLYLTGIGAKKDPAEGVKWIRKAAEQGFAKAQSALAELYLTGTEVEQDSLQALKWFEKAAAQNYPHAACSIGLLFLKGHGLVPANRRAAEKWLRQDAAQGCARAQFNLGLLLMPEEKSKSEAGWEEALSWLHKAADQDYASAQYVLGVFHGQTNTAERLKWFRLAGENWDLDAQARLGDMLSDGFTTTPDYPEAYYWLSLAASQGDRVSQAFLPRVERKLNPQQLTRAMRRVSRAIAAHREEEQKKASENLE